MVVGAKVCELTDGFLWFVCGLYVGILKSLLMPHLLLSILKPLHCPRHRLLLNPLRVSAGLGLDPTANCWSGNSA